MSVDLAVPDAGSFSLVPGRDVMLNQTNMGQNNNKFYVIQALQHSTTGEFYLWTHWGRVGQAPGQNSLQNMGADATAAFVAFERKFHDKTANEWSNRDRMSAVEGKYTVVRIAATGEDAADGATAAPLPDTVLDEQPAEGEEVAAVFFPGDDDGDMLAKA